MSGTAAFADRDEGRTLAADPLREGGRKQLRPRPRPAKRHRALHRPAAEGRVRQHDVGDRAYALAGRAAAVPGEPAPRAHHRRSTYARSRCRASGASRVSVRWTYTFGLGPSAAVSPNGRMLSSSRHAGSGSSTSPTGSCAGRSASASTSWESASRPTAEQAVAVTAARSLRFDAATGARARRRPRRLPSRRRSRGRPRPGRGSR